MSPRCMLLSVLQECSARSSDIHHSQTHSLKSYAPSRLVRVLIPKDKSDPQLNSQGIAFLMHEYMKTLYAHGCTAKNFTAVCVCPPCTDIVSNPGFHPLYFQNIFTGFGPECSGLPSNSRQVPDFFQRGKVATGDNHC